MPTHITNMKIVNTISEMQKLSDELRKTKRIGFVPTMGYLHEGHVSLVRKAKELGDIVITSIFVNPIQFGPQEDLAKYPRDFKRDAALLEKEKIDIIFHPFTEDMYFHDFSTYVEVKKLQDFLCGKQGPAILLASLRSSQSYLTSSNPILRSSGKKTFNSSSLSRRWYET